MIPDEGHFEPGPLASFTSELYAAAPQICQGLANLCDGAALAASEAVLVLVGLNISIKAAREIAGGGHPPIWEAAREFYVLNVRPAIGTKPEWDDIVSGKMIASAEKAINNLNQGLAQYLVSVPTK